LNSSLSGTGGIDARVKINLEKDGGTFVGNNQLPILNGAFDVINNSPDTVIPKFS
jgi:hypothetical protein